MCRTTITKDAYDRGKAKSFVATSLILDSRVPKAKVRLLTEFWQYIFSRTPLGHCRVKDSESIRAPHRSLSAHQQMIVGYIINALLIFLVTCPDSCNALVFTTSRLGHSLFVKSLSVSVHPQKRVHPYRFHMSLMPISSDILSKIVPEKVTSEQMKNYWGLDSKDKLQRTLESVVVSYGGAWIAWFVSFMAGNMISSVVGGTLIFNWMYSPFIRARRKNNKFLMKNYRYAILKSKIVRLQRVTQKVINDRVVREKELFTTKDTNSYLKSKRDDVYLFALLSDADNRDLEVLTHWRDDYENLRIGMDCCTIVGSSNILFSEIGVIADIYVPSSDVWIGEYPYLQKNSFIKMLQRY